jgi:pseudouridine-5'-phosphate glycosidase
MTIVADYITLAEEVRAAIEEQRPVVALESTVISHGLPYPANLEIAKAMEATIRAEGAVPATIALNNGQVMIGLEAVLLERLAIENHVLKVSRRDLAVALATRSLGATTVAGTMLCAHLAGIRFFATGGIGGVHRGATSSMDISADLTELSRTPVLVVCAGAKSILDLDLTLEYLETQGVPVLGWQTADFPAFYARSSGRPVSQRVDEIETLVAIAHAQWTCGLHGLLVTCPVPAEFALDPALLEAAITEALQRAELQGIRGPALTPFLLDHIARITAGDSIETNKALLLNNARWAARFAHAYYAQRRE